MSVAALDEHRLQWALNAPSKRTGAFESRAMFRTMYAALQTYLETDPSLRYVGFVGSFSSGKTATINNLLELPDEKKRPEDINPVDERLTVCAHESRMDSVLAALLKSAWQHDTFTHRADNLADVILVDTPGGGDPKIRTDIRARLVSEGMPLGLNQALREALSISTNAPTPIGEFQRSFGEETQVISQKLAVDIAQQVLKLLVQRCKDIRSDFDKTSRHSTEGELFLNERELREGCRREIASAVELYASLIDLYVAGINTAGTMLLIQKANLGRDIDFLQSERIDDNEKRATSEKLIQEIFGQEHQKLGAIEQRCRLIPQEMKSLMSEASALGA